MMLEGDPSHPAFATAVLCARKAGISEAQAKTAFETALSAIKTKLPESVSGQVDNLLAGKEFDYKAVLNDKLSELKGEATEKLEDIKESATETFANLKEDAAEKFDDLKEGFKKMF